MAAEEITKVAAIVGVLIAAGTLVKAVIEYTYQGVQKRAEHFLQMRRRFKENEVFKELCSLLDRDEQALANMPFKDKRDLLGFFEEVAIMVNSGLIRKEVAHYMFGYYAIRCGDSRNFWSNVNRTSRYWALFRDFAETMKSMEQAFAYDPRRYRF